MRQLIFFSLIGTALAAFVLAPIEQARAESADALRNQALRLIAEIASGPSRVSFMKFVELSKSRIPLLYGETKYIEKISCSNDGRSAPIFHYKFQMSDQRFNASVKIPQVIKPVTPGKPYEGEKHPEELSRTEMVSVVSDRSMDNLGGNPQPERYATLLIHTASGKFKPGATVDGLQFVTTDTGADGVEGQYGDLYRLSVTETTIADAQLACDSGSSQRLVTLIQRLEKEKQ